MVCVPGSNAKCFLAGILMELHGVLIHLEAGIEAFKLVMWVRQVGVWYMCT